MKEEIMEILTGVRSDVDFENSTKLIDVYKRQHTRSVLRRLAESMGSLQNGEKRVE